MYKLQNKNGETVAIQRQSDGASIPLDTDNTDYQAYLAWVAEGNVPTPAEENT
jgi:hypothetical protein